MKHGWKGKQIRGRLHGEFQPGLVSRAQISPRPPEQILLKRRLRLHGEKFSSG